MRKDAPIISCFHLRVPDPSGDGALIDDVSLELEKGSWNEFTGARGAGKSLLFHIFSLRGRAPDGNLVIDGRNLDRLSTRELADVRRRFSSCAESPLLLEERTVVENMVLPFVVRGDSGSALRAAESMLEDLDFESFRDVKVSALSLSERAIVGMGRALLGSPDVILVDGLFDVLDEATSQMLLQQLQQQHLDGTTVIVFGRSATPNARRGRQFRIDAGRVDEREVPVMQAPLPEQTGRVR